MAGRLRPLDLIIRGVNRVSGPIGEVNKRIESMYKPITKVNRALTKLSRESRLPQLAKALGAVGSEIAALARAAVTYGAILGGAAAYGMRRFVDTADEIGAVADKIGITTDALQELRYAGEQLDVSQETLDRSLGVFQKNVADVARGAGRARFAFQALGIQVRDLRTGKLRPTTDLMEEFADRFRAVKDPILQSSYALAAFGNTDLVNVLNAGSEGISKLRAEAHDLGIVLDEATVRAAGEADNELRRLGLSVKAVGYSIAAEFLPMVIEISQGMRGWIKENREWIKTDLVPALQTLVSLVTTLVRPILKVSATTAGMLTIFTATAAYISSALVGSLFKLGVELSKSPLFMGALEKAMELVAISGRFLATRVFPMIISGLYEIAVAAAANPIGLAVVAAIALAAAGVYLYKKWEPFRNFIDDMVEGFRLMWEYAGYLAKLVAGSGLSGLATIAGKLGYTSTAENLAAQGDALSASAVAPQLRARDAHGSPAQTVRGSVGVNIGLARGLTGSVTQAAAQPKTWNVDTGIVMLGN